MAEKSEICVISGMTGICKTGKWRTGI